MPFGPFLVFGLFDGKPLARIFILLADLAIVSLILISRRSKTRSVLAVEIVAFVLLLLPILQVLVGWPLKTFNYFLFIAPFTCFIIFYLASLVKSVKEYRRLQLENSHLAQ